jgi:hypothetical protein
MNRFKYILPVLLACGMLIAGSGCKKLLELEPTVAPTSINFWANDKDALAGLLGGYSLLRDALLDENRFYVYGDVPANTFRITYSSDYSIHQIRDGSLDGVYYGYLENLQNWTKFYKSIAQANLLIEKIADIPVTAFKTQEHKNYFLGESYFLRAFNYFYISRVWGDVPLILKPVEDLSEAKNIGREKQETVLKQCLADLELAIPLLPQQPISSNDRGVRASKASAIALKAHIYAWMKNYPKCEEATRDLVANPGNYGLTFITDSAQYQRMSIGKSTEAIFEINISHDQNEGQGDDIYGDFQGIGTKTLYAPYLATRVPKKEDDVPWLVLSETKGKLFYEEGDLRTALWFYEDPEIANMTMLKKYANITYLDGDLKKEPVLSNNLLVFRLSDIILLRAEALYKTGNEPGARTLVNQIRHRARLEDVDPSYTGEDFFYELVNERQRELFAEGHAFWDLLRTGLINDFNASFFDAMKPGTPFYGRNYWPIPRILFKDNLLMKQTPYWNGRL